MDTKTTLKSFLANVVNLETKRKEVCEAIIIVYLDAHKDETPKTTNHIVYWDQDEDLEANSK